MVVPESVAVTAAVVDNPSHALAGVLVDEEHRVQSNAHHTAQGLRALGRADCTQCWGSRQPDLQLALIGKKRGWSRWGGFVAPEPATAGGRGCATATTATTTRCAAAAAAAAATGGAATATGLVAVREIYARMVAESEDIYAIHLGFVLVEAKAAPPVGRAICLNMQFTAMQVELPRGGVTALAVREGQAFRQGHPHQQKGAESTERHCEAKIKPSLT